MGKDKKDSKRHSSRMPASSSTKSLAKPDTKSREASKYVDPSQSKQEGKAYRPTLLPTHYTGIEHPKSTFKPGGYVYDRTYLEAMTSKQPSQTEASSKDPTKTSSGIPPKEPSQTASKAPTQCDSRMSNKELSNVLGKALKSVHFKEPSKEPSGESNKAPSKEPSNAPFESQSKAPSRTLSKPPTKAPSKEPSKVPTISSNLRTPSKAIKEPSKQPSQDPIKLSILNGDATSRYPTLPKPLRLSHPIQYPGVPLINAYKTNPLIEQTYPNTNKAPSQLKHSSQPTFKSFAPANVPSVHTSTKNIAMASRQTIINTLPPTERAIQQWVAQSLSQVSACPDSFSWTKISDGYHCKGTHHFVTHDLIAENKEGVYLIGGDIHTERWGPYYASNEETRGLLWYAGERPRPECATGFIGETDERGKEWFKKNWREGKRERSERFGSGVSRRARGYR